MSEELLLDPCPFEVPFAAGERPTRLLHGYFDIAIDRAVNIPLSETATPWVEVVTDEAPLCVSRTQPAQCFTRKRASQVIWEETFVVPVAYRCRRVYFHVHLSERGPVGTAAVDLFSVLSNRFATLSWVNLEGHRVHGQLSFSLLYRPAAAVPWSPAVPGALFPVRRGAFVQMYQDAHCDVADRVFRPAAGLITDYGPAVPESGWSDLYMTLSSAQYFIYISSNAIDFDTVLVRPSHAATGGDSVEKVCARARRVLRGDDHADGGREGGRRSAGGRTASATSPRGRGRGGGAYAAGVDAAWEEGVMEGSGVPAKGVTHPTLLQLLEKKARDGVCVRCCAWQGGASAASNGRMFATAQQEGRRLAREDSSRKAAAREAEKAAASGDRAAALRYAAACQYGGGLPGARDGDVDSSSVRANERLRGRALIAFCGVAAGQGGLGVGAGPSVSSHNECIVVCDAAVPGDASARQVVAFSGGLELRRGRYDTPSHPVLATNATVHVTDHCHSAVDGVEIERGGGDGRGLPWPREPSHTTMCRVEGPPAHDIMRVFEHVWLRQVGAASEKGSATELITTTRAVAGEVGDGWLGTVTGVGTVAALPCEYVDELRRWLVRSKMRRMGKADAHPDSVRVPGTEGFVVEGGGSVKGVEGGGQEGRSGVEVGVAGGTHVGLGGAAEGAVDAFGVKWSGKAKWAQDTALQGGKVPQWAGGGATAGGGMDGSKGGGGVGAEGGGMSEKERVRGLLTQHAEKGGWSVQVLRSAASMHSLLDRAVDVSLRDGYVHWIRQAERFIYIETSAFVGASHLWRKDPRVAGIDYPLSDGERRQRGAGTLSDSVAAFYKKVVASAAQLIPTELALKICSKIATGEPFCVYLVVPLTPPGPPSDPCSQATLRWQFLTMEFLYRTISHHLREANSAALPTDYLSVFFLASREPSATSSEELQRAATMLGNPSSEAAAVAINMLRSRRSATRIHGTVMVVDDRVIVNSSGGMCPSSLDGFRDSECGVAVRQPHQDADGDVVAKGSVYGYRLMLWLAHLRPDGPPSRRWDEPESPRCVRSVRASAAESQRTFFGRQNAALPSHLCLYPYIVNDRAGGDEVVLRAGVLEDGEGRGPEVVNPYLPHQDPLVNLPASKAARPSKGLFAGRLPASLGWSVKEELLDNAVAVTL